MTKEEKIRPRYDFFKKLSTLIALIGIVIAATVGSYQLIYEISKARELQKEVKVQLSIGDKFLEQLNYDRAIEEYEKVLQFDKDNIEAYRRIITTERKQLQFRSWYRTWGSERRNPSDPFYKEVDDTLALIYRIQILDPSLEDDVELLLEEALLYEVDGRVNKSITILEKAHNLSPQNPDVLAKLGYIRVMVSPNKNTEGFDFIRRAITIEPDNMWFHYYLAEASEEAGLYVEAVREYNRTATLAGYEEGKWPARLRERSLDTILYSIFIYHARNNDRLLSTEFDMPLEERADILKYYIENGEYSSYKAYLYLARTYYELDELENATRVLYLFPYLENEYTGCIAIHVALTMILEEGSFDEIKLKEVRARDHYLVEYSDLDELWPKAYAYYIVEIKS